MKIRKGFVSNSSSSSFIVHKSEIGEGPWLFLQNYLTDFVDKNNVYGQWGNSGYSFFYQGNYLFIELYHAPDEVVKTVKKYVTSQNSLSVDGF